MRRCSGFTLIELVVTVVLAAMLVMAAAPLATNWVSSSQTHNARTQLLESFSVAKALALENPTGAALPAAAAGMKVSTNGTTTTVYVCSGSSTNAACGSGGGNVQWSTTYSGLVSTSINGTQATTSNSLTLDIDNRGEALTATTFVLSRGAASNNETGTLY